VILNNKDGVAMHPDQKEYARFTNKARLDKSLNSLIGLIEGITIDGVVNPTEYSLLRLWFNEHEELRDSHPYNELIPLVQKAISDGVIDEDERESIHWLCQKMLSTDYYDVVTSGLQVLHGILGGIASDGKVTEVELRGLRDWLSDNEHLRTCYPYDEVDSLITKILSDGKIDEHEHRLIQQFFSEFISVLDDKTISNPVINKDGTIEGVCASCPEIIFENSSFCFTGASNRFNRAEFEELVNSLGGKPVGNVSQKLNYLVIGSEGNQCWAYACYGRKVEKAVELRKQGVRIMIVHENDFHDAVADAQ
jgi:NAD-dependent DNA ligase